MLNGFNVLDFGINITNSYFGLTGKDAENNVMQLYANAQKLVFRKRVNDVWATIWEK